MSRSNPVITNNPTTHYFEWDGAEGGVRYYDKETESQVKVDMPFIFLYLDQLARIGGWNDSAEKAFWSNEVRNISKDVLNVRLGQTTTEQGLYKDIKDDIKQRGARYISSVYIAHKLAGELTIGNLQLKGAALSQWMDFMKKHQQDIHNKAVKMTINPETFKKGSVSYRIPDFFVIDTTEEANEKAIHLDRELQTYLKNKDTQPAEVAEEKPPTEEKPPVDVYDDMVDEEMDDLPF